MGIRYWDYIYIYRNIFCKYFSKVFCATIFTLTVFFTFYGAFVEIFVLFLGLRNSNLQKWFWGWQGAEPVLSVETDMTVSTKNVYGHGYICMSMAMAVSVCLWS